MTSEFTSDSVNRNAGTQWFITFPHSNIEKDLFADEFISSFPATKYCCSEEKHKDGTPHLHLLVHLQDGKTKTQLLKYFSEKYPEDNQRIQVQRCRNFTLATNYLFKEDLDPHSNIQPSEKNCRFILKWKKMKVPFKDHPDEKYIQIMSFIYTFPLIQQRENNWCPISCKCWQLYDKFLSEEQKFIKDEFPEILDFLVKHPNSP